MIRDKTGTLLCQERGCGAKLHGVTGLRELIRLQAHMLQAHGQKLNLVDAMELRAAWERKAK